MAIGNDIGIHQMRQMQRLQEMNRQRSVGPELAPNMKEAIPAGSLIISDTFQSSDPATMGHGEIVNLSAKRDGFKGAVFTQSYGAPMNRSKAGAADEQTFLTPGATPAQTRAAVGSYAKNHALFTLEGQIQAVNNATSSGARNSVLNMSQGNSQAGVTSNIYFNAATAWDPKAPAQHQQDGAVIAKNLSTAYGLDYSKLTSADPKVSGPERARLQQAIMSGVDSGISSSPEVAKAKKEFATAVGRFESGLNSVVISAGNHGDVLPDLKKDAHGYTPKNVPANFNTNFLDTPAATMVGATRWRSNGGQLTESVADYNSTNSGNDIYASGSVGLKERQNADTFGTSFAAPRVAATMATLHRMNPTMSSAQIEALMKSSLTHQLDSGNGTISVLDYQKSSDLMVGR